MIGWDHAVDILRNPSSPTRRRATAIVSSAPSRSQSCVERPPEKELLCRSIRKP